MIREAGQVEQKVKLEEDATFGAIKVVGWRKLLFGEDSGTASSVLQGLVSTLYLIEEPLGV